MSGITVLIDPAILASFVSIGVGSIHLMVLPVFIEREAGHTLDVSPVYHVAPHTNEV